MALERAGVLRGHTKTEIVLKIKMTHQVLFSKDMTVGYVYIVLTDVIRCY